MELQSICYNPTKALFQNTCPAGAMTADAALNILSQPWLEQLSYHRTTPDNMEMAASVFSELTEDHLKNADCKTLKSAWRRFMLLVHPDKAHGHDKRLTNLAASNLNNAIEAMECRPLLFSA